MFKSLNETVTLHMKIMFVPIAYITGEESRKILFFLVISSKSIFFTYELIDVKTTTNQKKLVLVKFLQLVRWINRGFTENILQHRVEKSSFEVVDKHLLHYLRFYQIYKRSQTRNLLLLTSNTVIEV